MKKSLLKIAGVIICFLLANSSLAQTTITKNMVYQGISRSYRIYVPAIYNGSISVPLIFNLHGYGSNNTQQEQYGDFRSIADTANFILVHPNGVPDGSMNLAWNTFDGSTIDDVGFISALIDSMSASYNIDVNRVYSTGMSNGGFMSYELACQLSHRIAAIASVTGTMLYSHKNACNSQHPVPVMQIHGTSDGTVPYNGTAYFMHIDSLVNYWVNFNGCNPNPTISQVANSNSSDGCTAEHALFNNGLNGSTVEFYKISGGGHSWPGAPININVTNMDFNASMEIWRFFRKYNLSSLVSVSDIEKDKAEINIYPNPFNDSFTITRNDNDLYDISMFDISGKLLTSQNNNTGTAFIQLKDLSPGIYFIRIVCNGDLSYHKLIRQ